MPCLTRHTANVDVCQAPSQGLTAAAASPCAWCRHTANKWLCHVPRVGTRRTNSFAVCPHVGTRKTRTSVTASDGRSTCMARASASPCVWVSAHGEKKSLPCACLWHTGEGRRLPSVSCLLCVFFETHGNRVFAVCPIKSTRQIMKHTVNMDFPVVFPLHCSPFARPHHGTLQDTVPTELQTNGRASYSPEGCY